MIAYRLADGGPKVRREDQVLWQGAWAAVGLFDALPEDPHFRSSGVPGEHLFVFPCTSVRIEREGERPFVADRTTVTFYDPHQVYTRSVVSPRGDRDHWFGLAPDIFDEILFETGHRRHGTTFFPFARGAADLTTYARQNRLVRRLAQARPASALAVEEAVLDLATRVLRNAAPARRRETIPTASQRALAERAMRILAERWMEPRRLSELAADLGCRPYHLSRVFRRVTGRTLHAHREQLRLSRALLELDSRRGDLAALALDLGYSSHSHFTAAFRRSVGCSPSAWAQR
ncbi:MAG: AraC family transcriptional regulator [Thermoanaerobaculia bacterium]